MNCYFFSGLHGKLKRYGKLFEQLKPDKPDVLFIGGDIFPNFYPKILHSFNDLWIKSNLY